MCIYSSNVWSHMHYLISLAIMGKLILCFHTTGVSLLELWSHNLVSIRQSITDSVSLYDWLSGAPPAVPWSVKHRHTLNTTETAKPELASSLAPNTTSLMNNT